MPKTSSRQPDRTASPSRAFEEAGTTAADVPLDGKTIGELAKAEVAALKAQVTVDAPTPDVEGTDLDGKKVKLSSLKGKVVMLDIWATWCPPCRAMIPHERDLVKKLKDKPFVLVSVSVDGDQKTLTDFLDKEPMPWSHWFDGQGGPVAKVYKGNGIPRLYLIDAAGVLRKKWVGSPPTKVLDEEIDKLVTAAEKAKG